MQGGDGHPTAHYGFWQAGHSKAALPRLEDFTVFRGSLSEHRAHCSGGSPRHGAQVHSGKVQTLYFDVFGRGAKPHFEQGGYLHDSHQNPQECVKRAGGFAPHPPLAWGHHFLVETFRARGVLDALVHLKKRRIKLLRRLLLLAHATPE